MNKIIDGKKISQELIETTATEIQSFQEQSGIKPGLAVVLVGSDPASQVYVGSKIKRANEVGIHSTEHLLPEDADQETLNELIQQLNTDPAIHGILVQLPLPKHLDEKTVIESINPDKDVDGFHPMNVGRLSMGEQTLVPCTPLGCMLLLNSVLGDLSGKMAVIVGRSNIVGKPMAALLLQANCSVTVVHSRSQNIEDICSQADILVVAVGRSEMVKAEWVKPGATVIDVGINATVIDGKRKLLGDVDFTAVEPVASAITPVPGGVGPMTIACLMKNTLEAARQQTANQQI